MSFLQGTIDFFTGARSSHMGSYQYVKHAGIRNGKSMSGAKLWAEIEADELTATETNLFSAEERILRAVAKDVGAYFPDCSPVLEMGTGTPNAFRKKTLLIMMALRSTEYICVDESSEFLNSLATNKALSGFKVRPILDDFFEGQNLYFDDPERDALVCMFGSTIGNIVAPLSEAPPKDALIEHLAMIAHAVNRGGLLVSFDADMDGDRITAFYGRQALFQLNTFFRMAEELPIKGGFDPYAFEYKPMWFAQSGTLAHMAIVTRDMSFDLGGKKIFLAAGQHLHMKNSFKFSPAFFSDCCEKAGFEVLKTWRDPSQTHVCLLKKRTQAIILPHQESLLAVNF